MKINSGRLKLVILSTVGAVLLMFFTWYGFVFSQNPGTDFIICTAAVNQASCYDSGSVTPRLNWTYTSSVFGQAAFWIQVDDNSDFSSLLVDTNWITSSDTFYDIPAGHLNGNTTYYWRIIGEDTNGSQSPWANADAPFVTPVYCTQYSSYSNEVSVTLPSCPPTASNLKVVKGDYCSSPPAHYFSWTYTDPAGDNENQFQFQVDNNSDFGSPEVNRTQGGLSNPSPFTNNQTVIVVESPAPNQIGYNDTYYWRVKVWDVHSADSGWINGPSFTTEPHRYPSVNFNWSPQEPSVEEDVLFADQSTVYDGAPTWSWTIPDANYISGSSSSQNPTVQFTITGDHQITLRVTDSDGFFCQTSKTVSVQIRLPGWKEILPW